MEKRNSQRVVFNTVVEVTRQNDIIKGEVDDLSLKGLFIHSDVNVELNDYVALRINLNGTTSEMSINIEGIISRIENTGFAITFKKMELDSYIILKNIVFYADEELHEFQEFL